MKNVASSVTSNIYSAWIPYFEPSLISQAEKEDDVGEGDEVDGGDDSSSANCASQLERPKA